MKTLTASDRSALIKLASSLPQGDETRKAILAGLQQTASEKPARSVKYDIYEERNGKKTLLKNKSSLAEAEKMADDPMGKYWGIIIVGDNGKSYRFNDDNEWEKV